MRKNFAILCLLSLALLVSFASAELKMLSSADELKQVVAEAKVPVVIQFSAHWCKPCKVLRGRMQDLAPSYKDNEVLLYHVDAYVNESLRTYLKGGYPTVRAFSDGQVLSSYFVGAKTTNSIKRYIDNVVLGADQTRTKGKLNILDSEEDFQKMITKSETPVMISFSAYWCNPCQKLKKTLTTVATEYEEQDIKVCYVDAYVNSNLKSYLKGGYPTVRVFVGGKLQEDTYFVGSKSPDYVRGFVNNLIAPASGLERSELKILETVEDFENLLAKSPAPIMISFSAYWCGPCQKLKKTLTAMAPDYNSKDIQICYIDAHKNPSLKRFLKGGYPTVRVFTSGQLQEDMYFVGNKPEPFIKDFAKKVMESSAK